MKRTHRICTFEFANATKINVAVLAYEPESMKGNLWNERTFEEMLSEAKRIIGWSRAESNARGEVKVFTVGSWIIIGGEQ